VVFDFLKKKLQESLPRGRKVVPGSREDYEERRRWAESLRAQGRKGAAMNLLTELEKDLRGAGNFPLAVAVRHRMAEWREEPLQPGEPLEPLEPVSPRERAVLPPEPGAAAGRPAISPEVPGPASEPSGVTATGMYRAVRAASTLEELSADEVAELVRSSGLTRFAAGETIVEEGTEGNALFVVTRGELEVRTRGAAGEPVRLGTLEVGDFFGEVALLTGRPRAATVAARTDAECLRVSRETWNEISERHPLLIERLRREIEVRAGLAAQAVVDDLRRRREDPGRS
jgi:hypothetical protein